MYVDKGVTYFSVYNSITKQSAWIAEGEVPANLPVTINNFINNPDPNWKQLAWAGALLITFTVLSLNIVARVLGSTKTGK